MNKKEFRNKCSKLYKNYDFSKSNFVDEFTPVEVICKKHKNSFYSVPYPILDKHYAFECPECKKERTLESVKLQKSVDYYLVKAKQKHGDRYDYSRINYYYNIDYPIPIYCKKCKEWRITSWYKHLTYGCICNKKQAAIDRNKISFNNAKLKLENAIKLYSDKFSFSGNYQGFTSPITVKCKRCGEVHTVSAQYIYSRTKLPCPRCDRLTGKSNLCDYVIDLIEKKTKLKFKREVLVYPYKLDGYNKRYNIAIEFNGDSWHGNPKIYNKRQKPNIFSNLTANKLYLKTKQKRIDLVNKGYKVITIWENDWNNDYMKVLSRVVSRINKVRENVRNSRTK